jgi:hypothetical protein
MVCSRGYFDLESEELKDRKIHDKLQKDLETDLSGSAM